MTTLDNLSFDDTIFSLCNYKIFVAKFKGKILALQGPRVGSNSISGLKSMLSYSLNRPFIHNTSIAETLAKNGIKSGKEFRIFLEDRGFITYEQL